MDHTQKGSLRVTSTAEDKFSLRERQLVTRQITAHTSSSSFQFQQIPPTTSTLAFMAKL